MKILIMGAGAVGLFYGARLQQGGEEVYYCARGENLRVLREHGLEVKSFKGDFHLPVKATDNPREFAPYELILFCVKSYDTVATARLLDGCLGEGGAVMTDKPILQVLIDSFRDWGRDCWCEPGMDNTCGKRFDWQLGTLPCGYDHKYTYSHIGYNLKATDMQAALGL